LVGLICPDDPRHLFFRVYLSFDVFSIRFARFSKRNPNCDPHFAFLGTVRFIDEKCHP
jgi:hypothetical protein